MNPFKKSQEEPRSKEGLLVCTIRELPSHLDHFQTAGKVRRGESENAENVTRFKYACGRNAERIEHEIKRVNIRLSDLQLEIEGFEDYLLARNTICDVHCKRDSDKKPIFIGGAEDKENGSEKKYTFSPENLKITRKEISVLEKEYKNVLKAKHDQVEDEEKLLDQTVEIKLHTFDWKNIPENISGTYLAVLTPMFTSIPEEE